MSKILVILIGITGAVISTGCRTNQPAAHKEPTPDLAAQVAILSNEVARLSTRLALAEQEWGEIKPLIHPFLEMVDEKRHEPIVEETLFGTSTNNVRKDSPAQGVKPAL